MTRPSRTSTSSTGVCSKALAPRCRAPLMRAMVASKRINLAVAVDEHPAENVVDVKQRPPFPTSVGVRVSIRTPICLDAEAWRLRSSWRMGFVAM